MRRRLVVFGALVACTLAVASVVSLGLVVTPTMNRLRQSVGILVVEHALSRAEPARRQAILENARTTLELDLSLYEDGQLLASNVTPALPIDLDFGPTFTVDVGRVRAICRPQAPAVPVGAGLMLIALTCLGLFGLSIPFARVATRPLEQLAHAARRFGEGHLGERAQIDGPVEVAETARAFNVMADKVAELRRTERELLANVSHELRTPMARMRVLLELIETNPEAAKRYVAELGSDLAELERLTDDIITTTHVQLAAERATDPYPTTPAPHDLHGLVTEVAEEFERRVSGRSVLVEGGGLTAQLDRRLVRRALLNLLENADRYSTPGAPISIRLAAPATIEVTDQGEGIAADDLPRLFEPFFRSDRSRTRSSGGLGLGLAFVQQVARLHGGEATVVSAPGVGSTFSLRLA